MNLAVVLGSPRGAHSVTLQWIRYLERRYPEHRFTRHDVGRGGRRDISDRDLDALIDALSAADAVIWTFPVYVLLVPAPLKRVLERLVERAPPTLVGKPATTISTSAHFYDHTAHHYVRAVCADLGMPYLEGLSAGFSDLLEPAGQASLEGFFAYFVAHVQQRLPFDPPARPLQPVTHRYAPGERPWQPVTGPQRVVIVVDDDDEDSNLGRMVETFRRACGLATDRLAWSDLDLRGGCLGCLGCSDTARCVRKDGFNRVFDARIAPADAFIHAATVKDRYLSARWKLFQDRCFFNGHRPVMAGKPLGWLLSGPASQLPHLGEALEGIAHLTPHPDLGVVTDEPEDSALVTARVEGLAARLRLHLAHPWRRPSNFLGEGGRLIFRDLVYGYRGLMQADHRFYQRQGFYDFPNRSLKGWAMNSALFVGLGLPWVGPKLKRLLMDQQVRPYEAVMPPASGT
jgi:multimeric flavodoxin WrbA